MPHNYYTSKSLREEAAAVIGPTMPTDLRQGITTNQPTPRTSTGVTRGRGKITTAPEAVQLEAQTTHFALLTLTISPYYS